MDIMSRIGLVFLVAGLSSVAGSQAFQCDRCYREPGLCRSVTGTFQVSVMSAGYNPVVTIPVGACYINLTEEAYSGNALALKASSGEYIFNGNWMMSDLGLYEGAGAVFRYSRRESGCPGECIRATGPTKDKVTVQLLYHVRNPGVHYTYQVPRDARLLESLQGDAQASNSMDSGEALESEKPDVKSELKASETGSRTLDAQKTSGTSGSGSFPEFLPVPREPSVHRRQPIFTSEFKHAARLNRRHQENIRRHRTGGRRKNGGSRRQALTDVTFSRGVDDEIARQENTDAQESVNITHIPRPTSTEETVDLIDGSGDGISLGYTDAYIWRVAGYSECSRVCGGGIQEVNYTCQSVDTGLVVDDQLCAGALRPDGQYKVCNDEPCTPHWNPGTWTPCTVTCGNGTQSRDVVCQQRVSATVTLDLADSHCTSLKPEISRQCYMTESCFQWRVSAWSECSVSCGVGSRQRQTECQDTSGQLVTGAHCEGSPPTRKTCDMGSCSRDWYYTSWSGQCSEDCETGVLTRQIHCATGSGHVLPDDKCGMTQKPSNEKPCTRQNACKGQWFTGPWSKCSRSCGEGTRRRTVVCMKKSNNQLVSLSDDQCSLQHRPETTEPCMQSPCGTTWYMTDWSQCSTSCGGGTRTRSVKCLGQDLQASTLCGDGDMPETSQSCNTEKCITQPLNLRCRDRYPNCDVVVSARLCKYPYYQRKCCLSCSNRGGQSWFY